MPTFRGRNLGTEQDCPDRWLHLVRGPLVENVSERRDFRQTQNFRREPYTIMGAFKTRPAYWAASLFLAMIVGFVQGLPDDRPSFWRGIGEGLAGRGKLRGGTYPFFHDRRSGLRIGTRIDGDRD